MNDIHDDTTPGSLCILADQRTVIHSDASLTDSITIPEAVGVTLVEYGDDQHGALRYRLTLRQLCNDWNTSTADKLTGTIQSWISFP